jgi:hypothetical protein
MAKFAPGLQTYWLFLNRLLLISIDSLCIAALIYVLEPSIFCFVIMLRNGREM